MAIGVSLIILMPQVVGAVLGGTADSVESDRKFFSAKRSATKIYAGYTVEQIDSSGTAIRQYISPSGIVFGIAWNGIVHPDLTQLLGSYGGQYLEAAKKTPRKHGRRYEQIKTDQVTVERWGHMRNLQGRAYAPNLIPQGVSVDEIS